MPATQGTSASLRAHPLKTKRGRWVYAGRLTSTKPSSRLLRMKKLARERAEGRTEDGAGSFLSMAGSDASLATTANTNTTTETQTPTVAAQSVATVSPAAAAAMLYSQHTQQSTAAVDEDTLARTGRLAKKRVEAMAQREALVGRWKRRRMRAVSSHDECHVMETRSRRRDEYKIVARMNISSNLREIMSMLFTDRATDFHRSMEALFGHQYVHGENLHRVDTVASRESSRTRRSSALAAMLQGRNTLGRSTYSSTSRSSMAFSSIKMAVNVVTLLLRRHLSRELQDLCLLEYQDEKNDAMAVTRVIQTIYPDTLGMRGPAARREKDVLKRRRFDNILAGYVIREDPSAQFTRIFFYAEVTPPSSNASVEPHVSKPAIQLVRSMVETLQMLVEAVERQRLSAFYRLHCESETVPVAASRCGVCNASFGLPHRRHQCACCRQSVCRRCIERRDIEDPMGADTSRPVRVCRACVDRVGQNSAVPSVGQQEDRLETLVESCIM